MQQFVGCRVRGLRWFRACSVHGSARRFGIEGARFAVCHADIFMQWFLVLLLLSDMLIRGYVRFSAQELTWGDRDSELIDPRISVEQCNYTISQTQFMLGSPCSLLTLDSPDEVRVVEVYKLQRMEGRRLLSGTVPRNLIDPNPRPSTV